MLRVGLQRPKKGRKRRREKHPEKPAKPNADKAERAIVDNVGKNQRKTVVDDQRAKHGSPPKIERQKTRANAENLTVNL
jgi:hypothetical protein